MKSFHKELELKTEQNNLLELEPNLAAHVEDFDYFFIKDFTEESYQWVKESGVQNGLLTIQVLHTTCVVSLNELDEPCLLGDINNRLRSFASKTESYLHNGPLRTKNLCEEDSKCDRNADAHLKATLLGQASQTVIIKDGKPVYGTWQRLCVIDLDGPRNRKVYVQAIGG